MLAVIRAVIGTTVVVVIQLDVAVAVLSSIVHWGYSAVCRYGSTTIFLIPEGAVGSKGGRRSSGHGDIVRG